MWCVSLLKMVHGPLVGQHSHESECSTATASEVTVKVLISFSSFLCGYSNCVCMGAQALAVVMR